MEVFIRGVLHGLAGWASLTMQANPQSASSKSHETEFKIYLNVCR